MKYDLYKMVDDLEELGSGYLQIKDQLTTGRRAYFEHLFGSISKRINEGKSDFDYGVATRLINYTRTKLQSAGADLQVAKKEMAVQYAQVI